jgi:hypothetical protein
MWLRDPCSTENAEKLEVRDQVACGMRSTSFLALLVMAQLDERK